MTEPTSPPRPGLRGLLDRWRAFAGKVARVQTQVLLTLVYGLMMLPLGFLMRLVGRSPLHQPRESAESAWTPRTEVPYTVERFKRLF